MSDSDDPCDDCCGHDLTKWVSNKDDDDDNKN